MAAIRALVAGNWKMNGSRAMAATLTEELVRRSRADPDLAADLLLCPPFPYLIPTAQLLTGSRVKLGAQDCHSASSGAHTGDIAASMLKDAGCSHVIIGHSERRQYFGETDETVNKKAKAAISAGLTAIVCVGETLAERESDRTFSVIETQLKGSLAGFSAEMLARAVIAYEPVWAIGTGKTASDAQAQEVHAFIRTLVATLFSQASADAIRILYGGSVKPDNVKGLMSQPDIDGALVGGASLKADSFAAIANFAV